MFLFPLFYVTVSLTGSYTEVKPKLMTLLSATDEGLRRYSVGIFALLGHPRWKTCQALPENKHHQQHKKRHKSVSLHGFSTLCQFFAIMGNSSLPANKTAAAKNNTFLIISFTIQQR